MLFLVVSYKEVVGIKQKIREVDPKACVVVTDAYDAVSYTHLGVLRVGLTFLQRLSQSLCSLVGLAIVVHRHLRAALVGRSNLLCIVRVRVVAVRASLLRVELDKMCIRDRFVPFLLFGKSILAVVC